MVTIMSLKEWIRIIIDTIVYFWSVDPTQPEPPPEPEPPEPEPPEPDPEPTPDPHPDGSAYVHMNTVARKLKWIKENSHIWAGVYDINFVLGNCKWAFPKYFNESELRTTAQEYANTIREGEALTKRLPKRHQDFPKRSRVRKSVWRDFESRLNALNGRVEGYRQSVSSWPGAGVYYDSIQGWCQYCNEHGITTPD
jgi:hypothetical protein